MFLVLHAVATPASGASAVQRDEGDASTARERGSERRPNAIRANSFDECARLLDAQGAGWCELGEPISTVWPERQDIRGWTGPKSILIAWNGMAVDRKRRKLYFLANGGHADYLGNEVYEFDLDNASWTRLTEPCPLTYSIKRGERAPYGGVSFNDNSETISIPEPECGPASAHTYDGVQFSRLTGTVFWVGGIYGTLGGTFGSGGELWEFNPSTQEERNGVAPLGWVRHDVRIKHWPTSFELPDGRLVFGVNATGGTVFDPKAPSETKKPWPDARNAYGSGNAIYDPQRRGAWFLTRRHALLWIPDSGPPQEFTGRKRWTGHGIGAGLRDGKLVTWNGRDVVSEFDPDTKGVRYFDWKGKKPATRDARVYSKWFYFEDEDLFVGVSDERSGILVYKHSEHADETPVVVTRDAQPLLDRARPGDEVVIPAGQYAKGIWIRKPLTVKFAKGATFLRPVGRKGVVVVANVDGRVVIDGLEVERPPKCRTNCAGVRVSGVDYDVHILRSRILNQEMGVLTDNRGGHLVIEDSVVGDTRGGGDIGHAIYVGYTDSLTIRRSEIRPSHNLGHLVKTRSGRLVIEDSRLLGAGGRHSRMLEAPCGADVIVRNSLIEQSDQSDNAEMMMIGGAPEPSRLCVGHPIRPSTLVLDGVQFVSRRDYSADEPARSYGKTGVMKWRAPNGYQDALTIRDTTFENVHHLIFAEPDRPEVPLP